MKKLLLEMENIKTIKKAKLEFDIKNEIHAITGINGTGKSTIMQLMSYLVKDSRFSTFGNLTENERSIVKFTIGDNYEEWIYDGHWENIKTIGNVKLTGFHEGSLIKGTRFSNSSYDKMSKLRKVKLDELMPANSFIKENFFNILYEETVVDVDILKLSKKYSEIKYGYKGVPYFLKKNDNTVCQLDMSSGEYLLLNLLHLINSLIDSNKINSSLILIDEIELSLHPGAVNRLYKFMESLTTKYNACVYFATHSVEIIKMVKPNNLYYLQHAVDNILIANKPSYPAYVTRDIYSHSGFDTILLVEDDLAEMMIKKVLSRSKFDNYKFIQVLPVGGYSQVIEMHNNFIDMKIVSNRTDIISIFDGDVESEVIGRIRNKKAEGGLKYIKDDKLLFLPIKSLEKYIKSKMYDTPDPVFIKHLRDNFFPEVSTPNALLNSYNQLINETIKKDIEKDRQVKERTEYFKDGKKLFDTLVEQAKVAHYSEYNFKQELCHLIMKYHDFSEFGNKLLDFIELKY